MTKTPESKRARKIAIYCLIGAVVVLAGCYGAGYYFTGKRLPANTTVAEVSIGGMSPAAATQKLRSTLGAKTDDVVRVFREDNKYELTAENTGMKFDPEATVAEAGGQRSFDPRRMLALVFGEREIEPVIRIDNQLMDGEITTIAEELDEPEIEPLITFKDRKPKVRKPKTGFRVTQSALREVIIEAYLRTTDPQEIPMGDVEPTVGQDQVDEMLESFAKPAMSGPVDLHVQKKTIALDVPVWEKALRIEGEDGKFEPEIDPEVLAAPLEDATRQVGKPAQDARIVIQGGKPKILEGKTGKGVEPEELAKALVPVLDKKGKARSVEMEIKTVKPAFDTKAAKKLKIKEQVSTFTTYYPPTRYRDINQGRAAELLNGTLLKPGETLSLNDTILQRTAANGYVPGGVIEGGKMSTSYGGGVSQVATTTYNAAFFAGLDIVQHKAHSLYFSRYPVGREATVNWGTIDLKVKNNTKYGVLITAKRTSSAGRSQGAMTVSMWSTKQWKIESKTSARRNFRSGRTIKDKSPDCSPQSPIQGFDIDVTRLWKKGGKTVRKETVTTKYNAADRIICVKEKKDKKDGDA